MALGIRIRTLWRHRLGLIASIAVAALAATWSVATISLFPPGLNPRHLEMASASTHVVIDTPVSLLVDLRQNTYNLDGLTNRAVLLGNVMASTQVVQRIAQRARVPVDRLHVLAPLTPHQAAPPPDAANARHSSDLVKSNDQYSVSIQANPTVPMLDIYAEAPTARSAAAVADAAVLELQQYLTRLAASEHTRPGSEVTVLQLGHAKGKVINRNVAWQMVVLVFSVTLAAACATVLFVTRLRQGWRLAALVERVDKPTTNAAGGA